jgi:polysaccharide pyruvyl transferase WcaK-like protein
MVASLASAVPVMVIGWSHKYLEVMERFGQQDMVLDYKKGGIEPIIDLVVRLISERPERCARIAEASPAVRQLSNRQIDYLVRLLESNA